MISGSISDRFQKAGLSSFLPYVSPWDTVAQAQGYRQFERDLSRQEQLASAEDRFMQAIQEDPQTGYEKFIAQNPISVMSPMVRAYAIQRDRMRAEPKQDRLALEAAQMGAPYLSTYEKGKAANPIGAYAEAVSQYNRDQAEAKKKSAPDDRLLLSGDPREEFDTIMAEVASARSAEPTDEEKMEFLDPARRGRDGQWPSEDWTGAYHKAKQKKMTDALTKLDNFQRVYGEAYKIPGASGRGVPQASAAPVPEAPISQSPAPTPVQATAPVVSETVTTTPTAVSEILTEQTPSSPRNEEVDRLWEQYLEVENTMHVDADSTNPSDMEADRELRGEKKRIQGDIMKRLKIPDTKEGNKLFQQMWQGRRNSLAKQADSRGEFLSQPLQKTGATGNTWVIRPA